MEDLRDITKADDSRTNSRKQESSKAVPRPFSSNTQDVTAQNLKEHGLRNVSENSSLDVELARYGKDMEDGKKLKPKLAHLNFYDLRSPALLSLFNNKSDVFHELRKMKEDSMKNYLHQLMM